MSERYEEDEELREMRGEFREEINEAREEFEERRKELEEELAEKTRSLEALRDKITQYSDELSKNFSEELEEELEELREELEETYEEYQELENEAASEIQESGREIYEMEREMANKIREKQEKLQEKAKEMAEKARYKAEKARQKAEKYAQKAQRRINISVPPDVSEEWKDWAENLGASVSELVRKSMKFVKNNIGDPEKLERWGKKMEIYGDRIEQAVQDSGIQEFGQKVESKVRQAVSPNKDQMKKRIRGMVKLQKSIPIDKFAQVINKSEKFAENLIYELVAEGIEGDLEDGTFKYKGDPEEMLEVLFKIIDKM